MKTAMKTAMIFDPLGKYPRYHQLDILDICGFLPHWALDPNLFELGIIEAMTQSYGYGPLSSIDRATVDEQGVMRYPGDPPQYPLIKIERGDEVMYQYQYGMVAFVTKEGTLVTRMD